MLLIDLANDAMPGGFEKVVTLTGTNAARTSASDAAVSTLNSNGWMVTTS